MRYVNESDGNRVNWIEIRTLDTGKVDTKMKHVECMNARLSCSFQAKKSNAKTKAALLKYSMANEFT